MTRHYHIVMLVLLLMTAATSLAQTEKGSGVVVPDTLSSDYEEWLRNEPLHSKPQQSRDADSMTLSPQPPQLPIVHPKELSPRQPSVSLVIMTPSLRTDMQLAYQSHVLEEQRKMQQGGAMTIGVSPLPLLVYLFRKIFPPRKSKKQRERERLKQILDNY